MIPIVQVQTAQQALEVLSLGKEVLVTPFPTDELMRRLRVTRAGAFDFCGTLVTGSQWRALESLLPMEDQLRGKANIDWVQAHRGGSDSSDVEDFQDWFLGHIHPDNKDAIDSALALIPIMLAEKAGVLMEDVCRVGGELPMRDGADLLMQCFAPSWRVIISFGIEQEIQQWLRVHELFAYVAATRLGEDPQGRVKGCLLNMVIASTKRLAAERFGQLHDLHPHEVFSIGDTIFDLDMMHPLGFNVLLVPPGEADRKLDGFRNGNIEVMWPKLTAIVHSDSLMPIVNLIRNAREG